MPAEHHLPDCDRFRHNTPLIQRLAELEKITAALATAVQRACDESDYCFACDGHPEHGHGGECPLVAYQASVE